MRIKYDREKEIQGKKYVYVFMYVSEWWNKNEKVEEKKFFFFGGGHEKINRRIAKTLCVVRDLAHICQKLIFFFSASLSLDKLLYIFITFFVSSIVYGEYFNFYKIFICKCRRFYFRMHIPADRYLRRYLLNSFRTLMLMGLGTERWIL